MSPEIARMVVQRFNGAGLQNTASEMLTIREREILTLLSKGLRYKEIAAMLFISIETVRKHARNTYVKLQVSSRTDALNKVFGK
jgi:DNA-binding NarL/FixJ family response regulator